MLVEAIGQLESSILQTNDVINEISASYKTKLDQYPPDLHPLSIETRFQALQSRIHEIKQKQSSIHQEKKELSRNLMNRLNENQMLLEQLLHLTEFSGDFEMLDEFRKMFGK